MHDVPEIVEAKIIQMTIKQLISSRHYVAQGSPCLLKHLRFWQGGLPAPSRAGRRAGLLFAACFSVGDEGFTILPTLPQVGEYDLGLSVVRE